MTTFIFHVSLADGNQRTQNAVYSYRMAVGKLCPLLNLPATVLVLFTF
jgi:hypothetical protein